MRSRIKQRNKLLVYISYLKQLLMARKIEFKWRESRPLPTSQIRHKKCLNLLNYGCCYLSEEKIRTYDLLIRCQTLFFSN